MRVEWAASQVTEQNIFVTSYDFLATQVKSSVYQKNPRRDLKYF